MTVLDIPVVRTERLVMRALHDDDLDAFTAVFGDERVYRWLGSTTPPTRDEMWRSMAMHVGHWALRGYGQWALELAVTGELVGRAGLWRPEGWPGLEVGWAVSVPHWRRGYATEAGAAALTWAFDHLDVAEVISITAPDNAASRGVMTKLGLTYDRTVELRGFEQVLYRITRDEWAGRG